MTSQRPYLIRAIYEWLVDNDLTPHLVVDADYPGVEVPQAYVQEGTIVLNCSPSAVVGLNLSNDGITFNARFGGQPMAICVPPAAVLALQARENHEGMLFGAAEYPPDPPPPGPQGGEPNPAPEGKPSGEGRPALRVVK